MFYQQSKYYAFRTRKVTSSHTSEAERYRHIFPRKARKAKHHLDAMGIFLTLYWLVMPQWKICFTDFLCSLELQCCRRNTASYYVAAKTRAVAGSSITLSRNSKKWLCKLGCGYHHSWQWGFYNLLVTDLFSPLWFVICYFIALIVWDNRNLLMDFRLFLWHAYDIQTLTSSNEKNHSGFLDLIYKMVPLVK